VVGVIYTGMGKTTIEVADETADELHDRKNRGDSYDDVIQRLFYDE